MRTYQGGKGKDRPRVTIRKCHYSNCLGCCRNIFDAPHLRPASVWQIMWCMRTACLPTRALQNVLIRATAPRPSSPQYALAQWILMEKIQRRRRRNMRRGWRREIINRWSALQQEINFHSGRAARSGSRSWRFLVNVLLKLIRWRVKIGYCATLGDLRIFRNLCRIDLMVSI